MATTIYQTIGANTYTTGYSGGINPPGILVTFSDSGTLTKITAYVRNTVSTSSVLFELRNGSAGSRGSIVATTSPSSVTTTFGWVDFTFASPPSVSTGTYWLQFNGDGANGPGGNISQIKYDTGGGTNESYWVQDSGTPLYGTDLYSMYATYTISAAGPAAFEPGPKIYAPQVI